MTTTDPNPFTPCSRAFLERADLSPETRLVAVYLDTFTAGWTVREAQVTKALGIGRRAYQRAVRELKAAGLMRDGGHTPQGVKPPVFVGRAQVQSLSRVSTPITYYVSTDSSELDSSRARSLSHELHLAPTPELSSRDEVPESGSSSPRAEQPSPSRTSASSSPRPFCPFGCSLSFGTNARMHLLAFHPKGAR